MKSFYFEKKMLENEFSTTNIGNHSLSVILKKPLSKIISKYLLQQE